MKTLNVQQVEQVNGGWSNDNNNTFSIVVRNAGIGAIGGALAGPKGAIAGAVVGAMVGFSQAAGNK